MPSHGNGGDPEQGCDRWRRERLDLVEYQDGPASGRQCVEGAPDRHASHVRRLRVGTLRVWWDHVHDFAPPNRLLAPLVATKVHEDAHQPRFFLTLTVRHRARCPGNSQEHVLHEVERLVRIRGEPTSEAIQSIGVIVEELRQSLVRRHRSSRRRIRDLAHAPLNVRGVGFVGQLLGGPTSAQERGCPLSRRCTTSREESASEAQAARRRAVWSVLEDRGVSHCGPKSGPSSRP